MIPNGRHCLLLVFPLLLCFVAPSLELECLYRYDFAIGDKGFTREAALKEFQEKYSTVEQWEAISPSKVDQLRNNFFVLATGGRGYKTPCLYENSCCSIPANPSESPRIWQCKTGCDGSVNECFHDMCNVYDFKGNIETWVNGTDEAWEKSSNKDYVRMLFETSPAVKELLVKIIEEVKKKETRTYSEESLLQAYDSVIEEQSNAGAYNALPQNQYSSSSRRIVYQILMCTWIVAVFA